MAGWKRKNLHDLATTFPGFDLYLTDPAQDHLMAASWDLEDVERVKAFYFHHSHYYLVGTTNVACSNERIVMPIEQRTLRASTKGLCMPIKPCVISTLSSVCETLRTRCQSPPHKRLVGCSPPFMRLGQHHAWCKQCLPGR